MEVDGSRWKSMEVAASNSPTAHLGEQREQRRGAADVVLVVEQRLAHRLTHGLEAREVDARVDRGELLGGG